MYRAKGSPEREDVRIKATDAPQMICEIAVWTSWVHCGTLTTTRGGCDLVQIGVESFRKAVTQRAHKDALKCLKGYARAFVEKANISYSGRHPISDVVHPEDHNTKDELEAMAVENFPGTPADLVQTPKSRCSDFTRSASISSRMSKRRFH